MKISKPRRNAKKHKAIIFLSHNNEEWQFFDTYCIERTITEVSIFRNQIGLKTIKQSFCVSHLRFMDEFLVNRLLLVTLIRILNPVPGTELILLQFQAEVLHITEISLKKKYQQQGGIGGYEFSCTIPVNPDEKVRWKIPGQSFCLVEKHTEEEWLKFTLSCLPYMPSWDLLNLQLTQHHFSLCQLIQPCNSKILPSGERPGILELKKQVDVIYWDSYNPDKNFRLFQFMLHQKKDTLIIWEYLNFHDT